MKKNLNVNISTSNSKLGGFIPTLNLPAVVTCRCDAPCRKSCYACRGNFNYSNVKASHLNNLEQFIKSQERFKNDVIYFLNNGLITYKYFRWHSSGDIINEDYFLMMVEIAKKTPQTKFLCFTKKYEIVNDFLNGGGKIPNNLVVVFSAWDESWEFENPYNLPVAYVRFKKGLNSNIPESANECGGLCSQCQKCWELKKGEAVVFNQH